MKLLDLTLPTPAENVALDEALLDAAEAGDLPGDVLRLWESPQPIIVVGRSSRVADEVNMEASGQANVPIIRRASGGAAIVTGPGCLMYAVILQYAGRENLRLLDEAHRHVLGSVTIAVRTLASSIQHVGTSDLALGGRKFSGNSLRCKRTHLLYHGTLLYDFDLTLVEKYLGTAPRQPAYRKERTHGEFVTNISLTPAAMKQAIAAAFGVTQTHANWPQDLVKRLVAERYSQESWNLRH